MEKENEKAKQALGAANALAALLADYGHKWTKKERPLYGTAYRWIISFCDGDSAA